MKINHLWAYLIIFILASSLNVAAQDNAPVEKKAQIVSKIEYVGLINLSPSTLQYAIKTQVGKPFSEAQLNRDIRYLKETGYFVAESIRTTHSVLPGDKIAVKIFVEEKPLISRIEFESQKFGKKRLIEQIQTKEGDFYDKFLVKRDQDALKVYYEAKGYHEATIEHRIEKLENNKVNLIFVITSAFKVSVGQIRFIGNKWVTDKELLKFMKTRPRQLFSAPKFVPFFYKQDLENIGSYYRSLGFLDAKVTGEEPKKTGKTPDRAWHRQNFYIEIKIEEGQRYKVGSIKIEGNKAFDEKAIRERIFLLEDGFYSKKIIYEDIERIKNLYGDQGRIFTKIEIRDVFREKEKTYVDVILLIREAPETIVDEIRVIGNDKTRTNIITRELELLKGEKFRRAKMLKSERNIKNLGLFKKVQLTPIPIKDDEGKAILLVEVEENEKTGTLVFGVGAGSNGNIFGAVSLNQRNFDFRKWPRKGEKYPFQGGGQKFNLSFQLGTLDQQYALSFYNPYIMDKPFHLGFGVSHSIYDRDDEDFKEDHSAGFIAIGRKFYDKKWDVTLRYKYDMVDIYDIDINKASQSIIDLEGNTTISMLTLSTTYSSLDSPFVPTRGLLIELAEDYAGKFFGGDTDFMRTRIDFNIFRPLYTTEAGYKHVLQFRARVGFLHNSDDVPLFERFFAGGIDSVRGFYRRTLGPKDSQDNPLGGNLRTVLNLEYTFPIFENNIRGAVFVDAGQVFADTGDFSISDFRYSAGIGLHMIVPIFGPTPIKIYLCKVLDKEDGDDEEVFQFMFGFKF